jgi:ligand-binding sensor domain-containing protein
MKSVATLRTRTILILVLGAFLSLCSNVRAEGSGGEIVRFDCAIFDTGVQNTGPFIQDRDGFLWLGANGASLVRYDAYKIELYKPGGPNALLDPYVYALYEDREGLIWIGTAGSGLAKYDKQTDSFTQYRHDPNDSTTIGGDAWMLGAWETKTCAWSMESRIHSPWPGPMKTVSSRSFTIWWGMCKSS